ncbi:MULTISPECIES: MMPL family transporter [Metabacillus]|uniref:MMPL domain-containing protein n=2 Tax=Metabacillus TaxID=2675233 RepID=A0A179T6G5_9BACI|nr:MULTISPECIES: MMPL family transporter [Metabacillus]OAS89391.1 MMPL domain-containing protein [Metabacillus litoralis]QNF28907.1 MMPL family transporter [Metabacillus sp. KUDC1714]
MKKVINYITDFVSTRKGMWLTLGAWLVITLLLAGLAPSAKDYEVSGINSLPDDAKSVIAQNKVDHYFKDNDGLPALLVFQNKENKIEITELTELLAKVEEEDIEGVKEIIPLSELPPQAAAGFFSEDGTTAVIPLTFESSLDTTEMKEAQEKIQEISEASTDLTLYITGPAGIAVNTLDLFSRADVVLILSTVGIILVLLIVIYRSPLLALIPLIAAAIVYEVVNQTLGLMGKAGLVMDKQTLSIMSILLFAAVIDYSLFVFSRFREELKDHENKYLAMKSAMRETGIPVFYSGGTVLAAMLVLFFAEFGDYRNFAPTFGTTMVVIMLASITLVPALFTLFGRKSFWPKVPKVGAEKVAKSSFWGKIGQIVVKKPIGSAIVVGFILLVSASNMFQLNYQFDTLKSFPEDMPSRQGFEILEDKFEKGDLAPTTVLLESQKAVSAEEQKELLNQLSAQSLVSNVRIDDSTDDKKVIKYSLTFEENPYSTKTMDALVTMIDESEHLLTESHLEGKLYFAGETATQVDDRSVNNRDLVVIVLLETILIFIMLIFLTKSIKMPLYMMGTILLSFLAALGLGMFLTSLFFDIDSISNRVPLYSFVFLVALGIDYNIILISRFMEERRKHSVQKSVEIAVSSTGGVISSAGILLASTFAVLMTQPIEILFVFGFIVAVGILLDTFLIRGVLLPSLLVLFEKDKEVSKNV